MFEAVLTLCLAISADLCRDQLVPGYQAPTKAACMAALKARPPRIEQTVSCQPIGEALEVEEVAPGVFVHMGRIEEPTVENRGDVSNSGFVIGETRVAVFDTGTARWMGEALWRAIRAQTDKPISHVILSHMHPDHVLGAEVFAESGAAIVGHQNLQRALADRQENYRESLSRLIGPAFVGTGVAAVTLPVKDRTEIDLGGRTLEVRAWPMAHTGTDLTLLDRGTGTLFAGDLIFHRHTPALDGKLIGWRAVLNEMSDMDVQRVVPGHGGPALDWPAGVRDMQRYLAVLERDTRAAIDNGERLARAVEHIAAEEAGAWELFEAYNPRNATVAFTELEWE